MEVSIFISWSGERSKAIAEALRIWIPIIIQRYEKSCWISASDIDPGKRWNVEVAKQLERSECGIFCLTKDNINAPWILFEAGAISKNVDTTFVCPYLHEFAPKELKGPLSQFEATTTDKEGTRKLIHSLNKKLGPYAVDKYILDKTFNRWWPDLKKAFDKVKPLESETDTAASSSVARTTSGSLRRIWRGSEEFTKGLILPPEK